MATTFTVTCRNIEYESVIDDCDVDLLTSHYKWGAMKNKNERHVYVKRNTWNGGKVGVELLHRLIYERMIGRKLTRYEFVDHRDTNSLNNCRENLRLASPVLNNANMKTRTDSTTGLKGVQRNHKRWQARITVNGVKYYLGTFDTPELAHEAYKQGAIKHFGEFARFD